MNVKHFDINILLKCTYNIISFLNNIQTQRNLNFTQYNSVFHLATC